jgi:hypothetical protein
VLLLGAPLGQVTAVLRNIILGWKGLTVTNTLVYYESEKFYNIGPWFRIRNVSFSSLFMSGSNKLESLPLTSPSYVTP